MNKSDWVFRWERKKNLYRVYDRIRNYPCYFFELKSYSKYIYIEENVENTQSMFDIKISRDFIFDCRRKFEKY